MRAAELGQYFTLRHITTPRHVVVCCVMTDEVEFEPYSKLEHTASRAQPMLS